MTPQAVSFTGTDLFSRYCKEIGDTFCPYLLHAEKKGVLFKTDISFHRQASPEEIQEELFYFGLQFTEELRKYRVNNPNSLGLYYCNNLLFETPEEFRQIEGNQFFDWPHWILKCLYSKVGVMFGKFWINEELTSRSEINVPSPPINFLSIRSAIKPKDPYFLSDTEFILQEMLTSSDHEENIHAEFGFEICDLQDRDQLRQRNYYQNLKDWASTKIPSQ